MDGELLPYSVHSTDIQFQRQHSCGEIKQQYYKNYVVFIQICLFEWPQRYFFQTVRVFLPRGGKGSQRATALELFRALQSTDMKPDSWPTWRKVQVA